MQALARGAALLASACCNCRAICGIMSMLSLTQLLDVAGHWLPCQGELTGRMCNWPAHEIYDLERQNRVQGALEQTQCACRPYALQACVQQASTVHWVLCAWVWGS